jgi:surface antigen
MRQPVETSAASEDGFFARIVNAIFPAGASFAGAAAYSAVVLAVGAGAGWIANSTLTPGGNADQFIIYRNGGMAASGKLQEALNSAKSGQIVTVSGEANTAPAVRPVLTFRGLDGQFCRQYEVVSGDARGFAGLACRTEDGTWNVTAHKEAFGGSAAQVSLSEQTKVVVPAIEGAVDRSIEGEALSADEEAATLANGWATTTPIVPNR